MYTPVYMFMYRVIYGYINTYEEVYCRCCLPWLYCHVMIHSNSTMHILGSNFPRPLRVIMYKYLIIISMLLLNASNTVDILYEYGAYFLYATFFPSKQGRWYLYFLELSYNQNYSCS